MEEEWMRDRALLRGLLTRHPDWTRQHYAEAVGRSVSWVKKWRKRLCEADPHDPLILLSRSRAHHAPYPCLRPACGRAHRGDASLSPRKPQPRARTSCLTLLLTP